jgi:hypothetical protein
MEPCVEDLREQQDNYPALDPGGLWHAHDQHSDPTKWCDASRWRTESTTASGYLTQLSRPIADEDKNQPQRPGTVLISEVGGSA